MCGNVWGMYKKNGSRPASPMNLTASSVYRRVRVVCSAVSSITSVSRISHAGFMSFEYGIPKYRSNPRDVGSHGL